MAYVRPDKFNHPPWVHLADFSAVSAGDPGVVQLGPFALPAETTELAIAWEGVIGSVIPQAFPLDLQIPNDGPESNPAFGDWLGGQGFRVPSNSFGGIYWSDYIVAPGGLAAGDPPGQNYHQPYDTIYPTTLTFRLRTGGVVGETYVTGGELFYALPGGDPPPPPPPPDPCAPVPRPPWPYTTPIHNLALVARTRRRIKLAESRILGAHLAAVRLQVALARQELVPHFRNEGPAVIEAQIEVQVARARAALEARAGD